MHQLIQLAEVKSSEKDTTVVHLDPDSISVLTLASTTLLTDLGLDILKKS